MTWDVTVVADKEFQHQEEGVNNGGIKYNRNYFILCFFTYDIRKPQLRAVITKKEQY